MKVFISQPMKGRTDKEILDERDAVIEYLKQKYSDISIIDSFLDISVPSEVKTTPVFYLGKSIQLLSEADLCVVVGDVSDNNGCQIEMEVCKRYGIELIQLSLTPNPDKLMDLNYLLSGLEDFVMESNNVHIENNINIPTEDEKIDEEIKKQAEEAGLEEGAPEVTE